MNISLRNPDLEEMENTHAQHRANVDKLDNERRAQLFNTPLNDADKEAYEAWQAEATAGGLYEENNPADYDSVGHFYRSQKAKDEGRAEENPFAFDEQFAKPTNPRYNPKVGEWSEARLREKADEANATIEAAKARAEEQMEQWKRLSPAQRELAKLYADASKLVAQEGETFTRWGLLPQEEREMRYRALANRMAKLFVGNDAYVPSKDFAEWNGWQPMADGQAMVQRMVEVMSSGGQVLESDLAKEYRARLEQADPNDPKAAEAIATQLMHERGYFDWTREGKSTWDKLGSIVKNIPTFMPTVAGSPAAGTLTKQDFQRSSNEVTKGQAADVAKAKQKFNTDLMRSEAILQWMQIAPSLTDNANSIIARAINAGGADQLDTGWTIPRILGAYHHMGGEIQDFFFLNEEEQEKVAGLLGVMRGKREASLANWAQDLGLGIKDRSLEILFALPGMLSKTSRNAMIDRAFGDGTADAWMRAEQRLYNATADIEVDYGFVGNGLKGALEQMPVWATLALGGMSGAAVKSGTLLKGGTKLGQLAATHGAQVALTTWYANMARDEFVRQGGSWEAGTVIGLVVGLAQSLIETQQANQLWGSNLTERQAQTAFVRAAKLLVADSTKGKWKRVFSKEGAGVAKDLLATWALETGQETFEEGLQKFAESFGIELGLSADVVKALKKAAKDGVQEMYDTASTMGWSTLLGSGRRASREIGRHYAMNERVAADGAWVQFLKANAVDISVEDVRKAWNEAGSEEARMQVLRDAGLDNDGAGILNRVFEARERQLRRYKDDARHFLGGLALGGNNAVTLDEQTLGVLSDVLGLRNVGIEVSEGKAVLSFDGATTEDGKTARERLEFSTADLQNSIVTDASRNMAESVYQSLDKSNALPIVDNKHITREAFIQQWTTDEAFRADVGKGLVRQGTHRGGAVVLDANRATIFTALHEVFHYLEERAVASGTISREELKEVTKDFRDKDGNLDSEAIADYFAGQYNWFEANRKANRTGVGEYDRAHLAILQSRVDEAKTEEERKAAMDALTAASKEAGRRASDLKKEVERDRAEGDRQLTRIRQRDERIAEAQQRAGMAVTRQEKGVLGQIKLAFQGLADAFLGYRYAQPHEAIDDFAKTLFNYPVRALARVAEEARRMGQMRYSITVDAEAQAQREHDDVVAQYKGTDQWLKAPNGKPTNLTERQWAQVRTPSFKKWFGDWENDPTNASKVVDENGEPKVVYHGTTRFGFTTFNARNYFATNIKTAKEFAAYDPWDDIGVRSLDSVVKMRKRGWKNRASLLKWIKESGLEYELDPTNYDGEQILTLKMNRESRKFTRDGDVSYEDVALVSIPIDENARIPFSKKHSVWDMDSAFRSSFDEWKKTKGGHGIYGVFLNIRDPYAIDVKGKRWNEVYDKDLNFERMTTDEAVASVFTWKNNDGVFFKDVREGSGILTDDFIPRTPSQIKSATDNIGTFNEANPDIRYSVAADTEHRDLYERYKAGDESALEEARQMVREAAAKAMPYTKVVDMDNLPRMMYHETNADNIHVFNLGLGTHAEDDSETPYGIFTKSTDANIGLGNKQMELFVNAKKTLIVADREAVKRAIPELVPYYDEIKAIDAHYSERFEQAETKELEAMDAWQEAHPDADMDAVYPIDAIANDRPANIDSEEYLEAFNEGRQIKAEWKQKYAEAAIKCKEILTDYLRTNGYDSMYFRVDEGTLGRKTDSFIVLDPNQVKSADPFTFDDNGNLIPLSKRFDEANDDIRYSISDVAAEDPTALDLSGMRYSITTEAEVADKIRAWADTPEAAGLGWTKTTVEEVLEETQKLLNAIHASLSGDINYDEWVKTVPTLRVDWRDGEKKPVVTWSRGNIEYKYDMSADTLCINNEGLETILSSPVMADLMIHMAGFSADDKSLKKEDRGFTSSDYLTLYETLRDLGFVVPCKGCFDAAMRFKMLPSVAQNFVELVNATIDERNKDPKAFDKALADSTVALREGAKEAAAKASAKNKEYNANLRKRKAEAEKRQAEIEAYNAANPNKKPKTLGKAHAQALATPFKDEKVAPKLVASLVKNLPLSAENKELAVKIGVAGDNLKKHITWTQLMSAQGQTKALADWGGIFRAWQKTGAGRPKDKLLPEPWIGEMVSTVSTIIAPAEDKVPSFRQLEVNTGTGLRRNSHSEFRPILAIDEIQFMREAYLKGLFVFKYMKELDDVRLFGKLGVKFNMSAFPAFVEGTVAAGLDSNGGYVMSEESVGGREFPYMGEDGKQHYDGMKGLEEAKKYVNEDVSLSSVIFSVPHLIKALTDVPTPSDKRGQWGSLIPFHNSGATAAQLLKQGLGQCRATDSRHPFGVEAMEDYHLGVTNFEQVQNDRFGEGWEVVAGKRAGTKVEPGHKIEFANGTHYFNAALGIHLFSAGIVRSNERLDEYDAKAATAHPAFEPFVVDYNNKVREIGGDYAYKSAADFYIEQLHSIGLMPRFEFEVAEETFLQMCREAKVDPLHPKLGYTPGQAWNPILAESYYSLFCDYGMTDPATGKWSPHRPVGLKDGTFALPDNAVEIIADGVRRYSERKAVEDSRTKEAIVEYCRREVELGKMDVAVASKILKKYDFSDKEMSPLKGAFSPTEKRVARAAKSRVDKAAKTLNDVRHSIAVDNTFAHPRAAALEVEHTNALLEARTAAILVAAYSEARNEDVSVADVKDILDGLGYSTVSPMAIAKKVNAARKNQDRERGQAFVKMASDAIAEEPLEAYGQAIKNVVQKAVEKDATNKALTRELEMATGVLPVEFTADNGFSVATSLLLIADDESKMTEDEIAARAAKRQQWREKREQLQRLAAEGDAEAIAELDAMEQGEPVSEEIIDEARMAAFVERQRAIREAAKELRKELDERDTARKPKPKRSANATEEPKPTETTEEDEDSDISDEMLAKALRDKGLAFADVRDLLTYIVQDITARYIAENPDATLDALKTKQVYLHELRKTLKAHILTASRELTYGLAREQIREEANKVTDRKTFAGILASAEHALTRLQSLRVKQSRKSIIADMVKIIDEALGKRPISATTAIQKRKLSGDEEMRLAYVRRVLKMGDTAVRRELERVNQVLAANNVSDSDTLKNTDERNVATAIMQRDVLNVYAGAKHMMPAQLEEMFEFLRDELNGAREAFEKEQAKIAAKIKEMKDWLALAIVQGEPDVIRDKNLVGKGIDSIMGLFRLRLEALLDRARGSVREKALEAIDEIDHLMAKAADDLTAQEMDNRKAVAELYKQCYGSAAAAKERLNEELPEEVRAKLSKYKTPMTRDHALYLYAYISQNDYNTNATKYGRLDGDYVKTLLSVLDKRDLAFLKGMQKILHDQFPALQAEYRKMTGSTVFTTPNYFPVKPRLMKDDDATVGVAESRSWAPIISELTPRVRHGYDTEEIRATEIFFDRLNKYARMMAYGNAGYIVNSVLLSGSVTNAIEAAWGKGETANLRKVLLDTFAGVQLPSDPLSNIVNWTTRAAAVGQLAYNLQSAFVQLAAGWIASGHELGIGNVLKNQWQVMFGLRGGEDVQRALRILQSSNWYKARYGGGLDIHAREAMSMSNSSLFLRLYQAGMKPIQVADWWTSMNNAVAIYLKAEKDYLDKGFSPEEAHARAISAAGSHVERTQQSGRTQDQTNLIRRIPLARMFMMFASAPLQLAQYEIRAFQQLSRGVPGASNKVVNSMLINHVLVPALVALARAAWKALTQGDDDDETEEEERKRKAEWAISFGVECALGQYNAVPLLGSATSALANRILGGEHFAKQWSLANMSFASRVAKEGSDSVKALVEHFVNDPYAKPSWDEVIKEFNDFLRINPAWRTADNVAEKYSDKQLFEMLGADIDSDKIRKAKAKRTRERKKRER